MWMAGSLERKGSVEMAAMASPRPKATALQGASKDQVKWQAPVRTSHSLADESAEPVRRRDESEETSHVATAPLWPM
jgi:hypothetical protein